MGGLESAYHYEENLSFMPKKGILKLPIVRYLKFSGYKSLEELNEELREKRLRPMTIEELRRFLEINRSVIQRSLTGPSLVATDPESITEHDEYPSPGDYYLHCIEFYTDGSAPEIGLHPTFIKDDSIHLFGHSCTILAVDENIGFI